MPSPAARSTPSFHAPQPAAGAICVRSERGRCSVMSIAIATTTGTATRTTGGAGCGGD